MSRPKDSRVYIDQADTEMVECKIVCGGVVVPVDSGGRQIHVQMMDEDDDEQC